MTHLMKGSIGAGILAMPDAMCRLGVLAGTVGLLLIGVFATYCIQLLVSDYFYISVIIMLNGDSPSMNPALCDSWLGNTRDTVN